MGYAILRTQKLKDKGSIRRSLKHSFRTQDTPNADPDRTPDNSHLFSHSVDETMNNISQRLETQQKIRKNAVLAVEYLVTGSPEIINGKTQEDQDHYFNDAIQWLKEKHGAENVVYAGIHRDEQTPHLYAYVVPIDKKEKLNCRAFLGGSKMLNEMQTDFAQKVGIKHDLERGIEGSKAKHNTIKKYYAEIQKPTLALETPATKKDNTLFSKETDESFKSRITNEIGDQVGPALEKSKLYETERKRADQFKKTAESLQKEAKEHRELMAKLTPQQKNKIKDKADALRLENELEKEQKRQQRKHNRGSDIEL